MKDMGLETQAPPPQADLEKAQATIRTRVEELRGRFPERFAADPKASPDDEFARDRYEYVEKHFSAEQPPIWFSPVTLEEWRAPYEEGTWARADMSKKEVVTPADYVNSAPTVLKMLDGIESVEQDLLESRTP